MSTLAPSSEYLISPYCSFCLPLQKPPFAPAFWKSQFWCSVHPKAGNSDKYDQSKSEWPHSLCRSSEPGEWPDPSFETWRGFCWWALSKVLHSLQTPRRKGYFLSLNIVYTMTPGIIVGVFWSQVLFATPLPKLLGKIGENHDTCYFWTLSQPIAEPLKCVLHPTELGLFLLSAVCTSTDTDLFTSSCVAEE